MESEEVLKYYLDEVKDTQHDTHIEEEIVTIPNEAEQAADFLLSVGLADLSKLYQQGKEIGEQVVNDSVRQRYLTEKQAHTIRSRVRILNNTVRSRQPRRKQRQDIRDVTWKLETSSTGSRSRSATPDSLDSDVHNDELTSDEDQQLSSLPPFSSLDSSHHGLKPKIKWTTSEPIQNKKFNRTDRGAVAHLNSESVVLKGYQPLTENGTLPRMQRERSGSDPTTEVHLPLQPLKAHISPENIRPKPTVIHSHLSRSHTNLTVNANNNCSKVYIHSNETNENLLSFETIMKQNETFHCDSQIWSLSNSIAVDELTDSEYQYLKPLLYVELVAIFDQYKINFVKRKASIKTKGGNVFGVNLKTLVLRDNPRPTDNFMVPEIFQSILERLNERCLLEEGILRKAGQKMKLETLCSQIEANFFSDRKHVENLLDLASPCDLTGALKKLLRELPDPVFTMELFDMFLKTSLIPNSDEKFKALNLLVLMLPMEHRNTYRILLQFFLNVIKHEKENRMNLMNVAMIIAPSFFPPRLLIPSNNSKLIDKQMSKEELDSHITGAARCCSLMEVMLKAGDSLWLIPQYLVQQAREAQKRAQDRKDMSKDKDRRIRSGKTKLVRSSTQYEPGAMNTPRIKRDFYI